MQVAPTHRPASPLVSKSAGAIRSEFAILVLGIGASLAGFWLLRAHAWDELRREFEELSEERTTALATGLRQAVREADELRRFVECSEEVTSAEFSRFAAPKTGLESFLWIPRVTADSRSSFEAGALDSESARIEITELDGSGALVRAADRADHFPIRHVEPPERRGSTLGLDVASVSEIARALELARDSGEPVAAGAPREDAGGTIVAIYCPAYANDAIPRDVAARRAQLRGYAATVLDLAALTDEAMDPLRALGLAHRLTDLDAPAGRPALVERLPRLGAGNESDSLDGEVAGGLRFVHDFTLAGRRFQLTTKPNDRFVAEHLDSSHLWIPILGSLLTVLLAVHVRSLRLGRQHSEQLVAERTSELAESEARFRLMADTAPVFIWMSGARDGRSHFNRAWTQFTGRAVSDERGNGWMTGVHPGDREACERMQARCVESRESFVVEYRLRRHDGEYRWIEERGVPRFQARGEFAGYIGSCVDVTERRIAEDALRNSVAQMQAVLASVASGVVFVSVDGKQVVANAAAMSIVGHSKHSIEFAGRDICAGVVRDDGTPFPADEQPTFIVLRTGRSVRNTEMGVPAPEGGIRWLSVNSEPLRGQDGALLGAVTSYHDITERRRADHAIRESEARLRIVTENARVGLVLVSPERRYMYANHAYSRMFGLPETPLVGMRVADVLAGVYESQIRPRLDQAFRGERVVYELKRPMPDGEHHYSVKYEPILDGERVSHLVVVVVDVTEMRLLEAQFRHSQKLEAVGQLAGGVAHDFNNILTAVLLYANLLEQNPSLDAEAREAVTEVERGVRRASDLTRQLVLFSRRSVMQPKPLELNEVLADLYKMLRRVLGEHIQFELAAEPGLPSIHADRGMLEQVVMNLCVNARDAIEVGGRLVLRTIRSRWSASEASAKPGARAGDFVCLAVTDDGAGMDGATLRRIFEPFFTTKDVGKGTGLGLATVHGIVEQHHGWIDVESAVGRGTTFRVYWPVSQAPAVAPLPAIRAPLPGGHETILLVEDEPSVRRVVGELVRRWGYRVIEASDAQHALAVWREHANAIDLLFTDAVMPGGMNGLQLAARLRSEKSALKVIVSTGYSADLGATAEDLPAGAVLVPKPCLPSEMANRIRACLDGRGTDA